MEAWLVFDDRKVWTDTAEVKNKASGPADRRWQSTRRATLCPFLTSSNQSKKYPIKSNTAKTKKYC
ncbi:hypothetical protein [uncultured Algoriphagus sp.]|uniref:hypothetical protein n=1 Tax=uncultured Algoriphagus sp. TaxID=417365 RepID=UPI002598573D|nr:hypothetical protein [uncultured Algoriphagus sp.]